MESCGANAIVRTHTWYAPTHTPTHHHHNPRTQNTHIHIPPPKPENQLPKRIKHTNVQITWSTTQQTPKVATNSQSIQGHTSLVQEQDDSTMHVQRKLWPDSCSGPEFIMFLGLPLTLSLSSLYFCLSPNCLFACLCSLFTPFAAWSYLFTKLLCSL